VIIAVLYSHFSSKFIDYDLFLFQV
jgi:hypothetical protein